MGLTNSKTLLACALGVIATTASSVSTTPATFADLIVGDFNGDGQADFIRRQDASDSSDAAELYLAANSNFNSNSTNSNSNSNSHSNSRFKLESHDLSSKLGLNPELTNLYVGDFNGDGLDDILVQQKDTCKSNAAYILVATGKGKFKKISLPDSYDLSGDLANIIIGDFNGDGKDDFIRQDNNGAQVFLSSGDCKLFQKITLSRNYDLQGDLVNIIIGDFNGDGKDDFIRQEKTVCDGDNSSNADLFLSLGSCDNRGALFQKVSLPRDYALRGDLTNIIVGDFNGDCKDDFIRQEKGIWDNDKIHTAQVFLSSGTAGQFKKITLPEKYNLGGDVANILIGDFNGDGKDDFFRQEKAAACEDNSDSDSDDQRGQVFLSGCDNSNSLFTKVKLSKSWDLNGDDVDIYIGDFNGDGKDDFIRQELKPQSDEKCDSVDIDIFLASGTNGGFKKISF